MAAERGVRGLTGLIGEGDEAAIAGVTVAELLMGVGLADEHHRPRRESWVVGLLSVIDVEDYDCDVARVHADLMLRCRRMGHPRGPFDLMIAATAVARGRTLITLDARSVADLPGVRVRVPDRAT